MLQRKDMKHPGSLKGVALLDRPMGITVRSCIPYSRPSTSSKFNYEWSTLTMQHLHLVITWSFLPILHPGHLIHYIMGLNLRITNTVTYLSFFIIFNRELASSMPTTRSRYVVLLKIHVDIIQSRARERGLGTRLIQALHLIIRYYCAQL